MAYVLVTPTPALRQSLDYYGSLGFEYRKHKDKHFVFDNQLVIEINENRFARPGIKLHFKNLEERVSAVRRSVKVFEDDNYYMFDLPGPLRVYLTDKEELVPLFRHTVNSVLGNFSGICIETAESQKASEISQTLGMRFVYGDTESSFFTMGNEDMAKISFMAPCTCPHLFFNPSLCFFNGAQNTERIARVRKAGVDIAEEITLFNAQGEVDNIVLRDPGGFGIFMFSDG